MSDTPTVTSPHLERLIHIARHELPALQYDLQNASTIYSLQAACQRMFETFSLLLHHVVIESAARDPKYKQAMAVPQGATATRRVAPAVPVSRPMIAPAPRPAPPVAASSSGLDGLLPPPPSMSGPLPGSPPNPAMPDVPPAQPGVANVFVTSQGTQVVAPDGSRAVLPAGAPVGPELTSGQPPELPDAPPGVDQVVLPPGGGMTPDVMAALTGRSQG